MEFALQVIGALSFARPAAFQAYYRTPAIRSSLVPFVSAEFLFALPIGLAIYYLLRRAAPASSIPFIIVASVLFISQDGIRALIILAISVVANYAIAFAMVSLRRPSLALVGVAANILYLGYFKYFNFFLGTFFEGSSEPSLVLPLGISFYTFHQIAFLLDVRNARIDALPRLRDYVAFVFFFPQLIAGPIVRAEQFFPQLPSLVSRPVPPPWILAGTAAILIGLTKKAVLADSLARYATPAFEAAASGKVLSTGDSWIAALAYTFQLYFDFSGYSDMAVGIALLIGIRLPFNFDAPYKARSIAEFWRRWHITLSTFLRDYVYIPLGGSRVSLARQCLNIFIVMLVCGLWHGAGWTFVAWGALHGCALIVHRVWRLAVAERFPALEQRKFYPVAAWFLTFLLLVVGWVLFRAETFSAAGTVLSGMVGLGGAAKSIFLGEERNLALAFIAVAAGISFFAPSLPELLGTSATEERKSHEVGPELAWRPSVPRAIALGLSAYLAVMFLQEGYSEFLYFNF